MISIVRARYGRLRGLLHHAQALFRLSVGQLGAFRPRPGQPVTRLVFVCSGNICRSPLAESVARARGVHAVSMGLHADPGQPAWPPMVELALRRGYDLRSHRSAHFDPSRIEPQDLVVAFEPEHARAIQLATASRGVVVTLLGLWDRPVLPHIEDPYGLGPEYRARCVDVIEAGVANIVSRMGR